MKKSKRLLSFLLALVMVFSMVESAAVTAWADDKPQPPVQEDIIVPAQDGASVPTTTPVEEDAPVKPADPIPDATAAPAAETDVVPAGESETEADTTPVAVPTRKEGYSAVSAAKVKTGMAYLLGDLQAGKIFAPVEGKSLHGTDYYYERSTDGGATWSEKQSFSGALFGATTIQLTENTAGVYTYRFYASHDGVNFSTDTWTLTLTVEDNPLLDFTFYVSKDHTGSYPIIKLYQVTTDDEGNEVLGDEIEDCFLYSDFTDTLPEGETAYNPADGKLVGSYQTFYASLTAGRYAYRAFTSGGAALGGMTLDLPTDTNVDGNAGGGSSLYLRCSTFYTRSKKADNSYFTADEYHVSVSCPIMKCEAAMGTPYTSGNYAYYPTVLYAAGNACLYNYYAYPDIEGYIFTQNINRTISAGSSVNSTYLNINTGIILTVTAPADADFGLYFQWNNFNTTEVEPIDEWTVTGATKSNRYFISKGNSNYTWRLSDDTHVTRAGWLTGQSKDAELSFDFADAATDRHSHDFSNLGTQTSKRDEADLQVNLDPSGFKAISGTTRVRAYRHWQLINSDSGNIMVEPDFHWSLLSGDAAISTVNGGNTTGNWADITPGAEDSVIAVAYDSVEVNPGNYGSHGGLFPATSPERIGVIVVGGTGVTHGTADADVDFNMPEGVTTTRSMDWDYNYDTWFYEAKETAPELDFAVTATGDVTVEYALVSAGGDLEASVSAFRTVTADSDGRYTVPLAAFRTSGNGRGGTVIIRMTDSTGVSYRLVRVAQVTITVQNDTHPGEDVMPGDQVTLTFDGMYRAVNKISGVFNPTTFKPTYFGGETKYDGTLGQYQKMDNASVTVTIPTDVAFADGQETVAYHYSNGYTFGSMYSSANPFAFLYNMTDTGVGTNFNAVTVSFYLNHYADAVVQVSRKVLYTVKLTITDGSGMPVEGAAITLTDSSGNTVAANEDSTYTLGFDTYSYLLEKEGYLRTVGSFTLGSIDAQDVEDGVLAIPVVMPATPAEAWDGSTAVEPKTEDGVYLISNSAELAWFAQTVNAGSQSISARLTADIELAAHDWTPIGNSSKPYTGSFNGNGHTIKNLYINSTANYQGLFGYLGKNAVVSALAVTGNVTTTGNYAGGISGYMANGSKVENSYNAVNVKSAKWAGGINGGGQSYQAVINNCYNVGSVTATGTQGYAGGMTACGSSGSLSPKVTDCCNVGTVSAAASVGALSNGNSSNSYGGSNYYLNGCCAKATINKGEAKTAAELLTLLDTDENTHPFKAEMVAVLMAIKAQQENKTAVEAVAEQVAAIDEVSAEKIDDIKAAIDAYDALTQEQQRLVPIKTRAALANVKAALEVCEKTGAISGVTAETKDDVEAAIDAYDALTPAQQELLTEETVNALSDMKAALDTMNKINAIGKVTKKSGSAIKEATAAFEALTDAQKALLSDETETTLNDAVKKYKRLRSNASSGTTQTTEETSGKKQSADTGDDSNMTLWLGGVVLSAAALVLLARKRREA